MEYKDLIAQASVETIPTSVCYLSQMIYLRHVATQGIYGKKED